MLREHFALNQPAAKRYLGDGVYVQFNGSAIVLTVENGIRTTDMIVLEPSTYEALAIYVNALKAAAEQLCEASDDAVDSER